MIPSRFPVISVLTNRQQSNLIEIPFRLSRHETEKKNCQKKKKSCTGEKKQRFHYLHLSKDTFISLCTRKPHLQSQQNVALLA